MKYSLILLLLFSTTLSCKNKSLDNSHSSGKNVLENDSTSSEKPVEITINTSFPFGCSDLVKLDYPVYWEGDLENYGHLKQPQGKEFEDLMQCFGSLNKIGTQPIKPEVLETAHIKIGGDNLNTLYFDTISQQNIKSLKYRLPNIGQYECYYFFDQSLNKPGDYGNLLLFEPESKKGKTLNIYYEVGGEQNINFRFFLIEDETIKIYEGSCYDDGCRLVEKYVVQINPAGQIIINELKQ